MADDPVVTYHFGDFLLDPANRRLLKAGAPMPLNGRYFDALVLLVKEHGRLVGKQRFFDEVWSGSVVTDAALTQCIKDIRKLLGDDASDPRFVRTVAGHGYCFISAVREEPAAAPQAAAVTSAASEPVGPSVEAGAREAEAPAEAGGTLRSAAVARPSWLADTAAATAGGGAAGLAGGLFYGSALAFTPEAQGLGSLSVLLVLLALNVGVGMAGALGVGVGIAGGQRLGSAAGWTLAGGALGGFVVGGLTKLLGSDALLLLVGTAPLGTTGGLEGAVIGFAVAAGLLLGGGPDAARASRPIWFAAFAAGLAGALLSLAGGSLMATSLERVAESFSGSRLDMTPLVRLFGEPQLGLLARATLGALECGLFGGFVAGALVLVRRHMGRLHSHRQALCRGGLNRFR